MWRRTYLLLLFVRIYFAFCPSYLHPDENFQGPEVIAGHLFSFPSRRTWEWTAAHPIRSVFPLWPVYGFPAVLLQWVWAQDATGRVEPTAIYYALRLVMFMLSFVLEDWAIHDLVHSPRHRREAVVLVASSYVTWTFQTHTFSNSVETLLVLWSLVLIERIAHEKKRSSIASSIVLGFLLVFGTFNRINFPAFILIPGIQLLPHFLDRPFSLLAIVLSLSFWSFLAIATDTAFYTGEAATASFRALFDHVRNAPVITPLNNFLYNTQSSNLAEHGLHPHYQHLIVNLPQLLGPALIVLLSSTWPLTQPHLKLMLKNPRLTSAAAATLLLSLVPHQEPRFLLPCIPLLLTCLRLPTTEIARRIFWISWIIFNVFMSLLMGIYHQGGIIPAQLALPEIISTSLNTTKSSAHNIEVFYWKTYPPPLYLLGDPEPRHPITNRSLNISTVSLMGILQSELVFMLMQHVPTCDSSLIERLTSHHAKTDVYVAAPLSAWRLEDTGNKNNSDETQSTIPFIPPVSNFSFSVSFSSPPAQLSITNVATFRNHINLDDLDFGSDGVWKTLSRVIGRRGLGVWKVDQICGIEKIATSSSATSSHTVSTTTTVDFTSSSALASASTDEDPISAKDEL